MFIYIYIYIYIFRYTYMSDFVQLAWLQGCADFFQQIPRLLCAAENMLEHGQVEAICLQGFPSSPSGFFY